MRRFYIKGYNKEEDYTDILKIRILNFIGMWFIDCGEWFVYFYFPTFTIRFSGAGNMFIRHDKKEHLIWLEKYHDFS